MGHISFSSILRYLLAGQKYKCHKEKQMLLVPNKEFHLEVNAN
jgi:hypothetical protein